MRISVGIDVAKEVHWAAAVDDAGRVVLDRRVPNDPAAQAALVAALRALEGEVVVGLDVVGGIAGLAQALLAPPASAWCTSRAWPSTGPARAPPAARARATRATPASSPTRCAPGATCA